MGDKADTHADLRQAVQRICADFPDEYWRERELRHEFPWDFYRAFADAGWVGIAIPAEYGGGGAGITEASIMLEEIAASGACMNGASSIHLSIFGMHPVVKHGSDEMKRRYLPQVASGDLHIAFGVTEPDAGLDTTAIRTRAVRDGNGYRVTGRKVWTSKALESDRVLLLTRTTPAGMRSPYRRPDALRCQPQGPGRRHQANPQGGPERRRLLRGHLRRALRRCGGSSRG